MQIIMQSVFLQFVFANLHLSNLSKYFTYKNFFNVDNLENSCIQKGNCEI